MFLSKQMLAMFVSYVFVVRTEQGCWIKIDSVKVATVSDCMLFRPCWICGEWSRVACVLETEFKYFYNAHIIYEYNVFTKNCQVCLLVLYLYITEWSLIHSEVMPVKIDILWWRLCEWCEEHSCGLCASVCHRICRGWICVAVVTVERIRCLVSLCSTYTSTVFAGFCIYFGYIYTEPSIMLFCFTPFCFNTPCQFTRLFK
jgi:hypothetical protein